MYIHIIISIIDIIYHYTYIYIYIYIHIYIYIYIHMGRPRRRSGSRPDWRRPCGRQRIDRVFVHARQTENQFTCSFSASRSRSHGS